MEELKSSKLVQQPVNTNEYFSALASVEPWYLYFGNTRMFSDFVKGVLRESTHQSVIYDLTRRLGLRYGEPLLERAWKVIKYVAINLTYLRDPYARVVLPTAELIILNDVLNLPNETVRRGGDCEDLSLLVYSLLKATLNPGEGVYLLLVRAEPEGHTAVLAIDKVRGEVYIIDPSWGMVNGYAVVLRIEAINRTGSLEYRHFLAVILHPLLKEGMFELLKVKVVYLDVFTYLRTGKPTHSEVPAIHRLPPRELLNEWLRMLGYYEPKSFAIASDTEVIEFPSLNDLIQWIESQI